MNIRSIIIDDEPNNIKNLENILRIYCEGISVVATSTSGLTGIELIRAHQPDLLFLDIQMPDMTGFDVLKALPEINFEIIFVTAFDQYGIQAVKFLALDYLLKPIVIDELKVAIEKAKTRFSKKLRSNQVEKLLEFINAGPKVIPKIALPTLQEIRYVRVDEIVRCEASNNYTTFFLDTGETVLVCKTLKEFSELLKPYGFIRSHQSHLANLQFVKSFLKEDGGVLLMKDRTKLPISRQNREYVKDALNKSW